MLSHLNLYVRSKSRRPASVRTDSGKHVNGTTLETILCVKLQKMSFLIE